MADASLTAEDQQANPNLRAAILVTGAHRTGTTWVGKMLAASGEAAYISEPLNHLHRPGVLRVPTRHWYQYICPQNEAEYLPALRETLRFQYHPWLELLSLRSAKDVGRMGRDWRIFLHGRLRRQRPLLKDPFAIFSIPWFVSRLGCQVVVTVRHPAAFASSLKRLDWPFDFSDLLAQPLLMQDWLEPYRAEMTSLQNAAQPDILAQGSLLWKMVYQVVAKITGADRPVIIVRHEDLSLDPAAGFRQLYQALGLAFTPQAEETIRTSSSSENPGELSKKAVHSTRLDSAANLHNWKRRLSAEEIRQVRALTEETAAIYYPELDWD